MRLAMPVIDTERLRLVPLALEDAAAMVNGHRPAGQRWANGYPTEGTLLAAGIVVTAHGEGSDPGPFTVYQLVRRRDETVIGDCGFDGPPDADGTLHVAFGIAFGARMRGYAVEALRALLGWALARPEVARVTADVARGNIGSIAVMERAGMRRVGGDDRVLYYEA